MRRLFDRGFTMIELVFVMSILSIVTITSVFVVKMFIDRYQFRQNVLQVKLFLYNARLAAVQKNMTVYVVFYNSGSKTDSDLINIISGSPVAGASGYASWQNNALGFDGAIILEYLNSSDNVVRVVSTKQNFPGMQFLSDVLYFRFSANGNGQVYAHRIYPYSIDMNSYCDQVNCWAPSNRTEELVFSTRNHPFTMYIAPYTTGINQSVVTPCPKNTKYQEMSCFVISQTGTNIRLCPGNLDSTTANNIFAIDSQNACN